MSSTAVTLVDDRTLSEILRGVRRIDGAVYTTGFWYVRLCQAVLSSNRPPTGQLSKPIASLPPSARAAAIRALLQLPDNIGMLSLRQLGPTIAELRELHRLNLLGIEALAAAKTTNATVLLSAASPQLEAALRSEGIAFEAA